MSEKQRQLFMSNCEAIAQLRKVALGLRPFYKAAEMQSNPRVLSKHITCPVLTSTFPCLSVTKPYISLWTKQILYCLVSVWLSLVLYFKQTYLNFKYLAKWETHFQRCQHPFKTTKASFKPANVFNWLRMF